MKVSPRAVRALLRALGDPRALRNDPLAKRLPGDVRASIRASLASVASPSGVAALAERRRRAARIIERCDLDGEPHDVVAAELGLSRRQFYRDRQLALELLAIELETSMGPTADAYVETSEHRIAVEVADALLGIGRFDEAQRAFERIATSAASGDDRLRAAARALETACERGDTICIRRTLDRLESATATIASVSVSARARATLARTLAEDALQLHTDAQARRETALGELRSARDFGLDECEALATGLVHAASAARERGEFALALTQLNEAQAVAERFTHASVFMRAVIPNEIGVTSAFAGSMDSAADAYRRAVTFARERGIMRIAVISALNNLVIDHWQGQTTRIYPAASALLAAARPLLSREETARSALMVAQMATSANRLDEALALLAEIKASHGDLELVAPRVLLTEIEVRLRTKDFVRAEHLAGDVVALTRGNEASPLLGVALLYSAEAYAARGNRRRATATVRDALFALERTGSAHVYARAQRLSSRLSGRAYAR
jgi:tetratricopeptide (TPR) repeat protein